MTFSREGDGVAHVQRRRHHLVQNAIYAEPDSELLLVGFDMHVAGVPLHRRRQDDVDQPDGRRLPARLVPGNDLDLPSGLGELGIVRSAAERLHLADRRIETATVARTRAGAAVVVPGDGRGHGSLRRHQRLDGATGPEPHVIERGDVAGIGHRDRQRRAGAPQRHDLMLASRAGRYQLQEGGLDLEPRQVDRTHAVLRAAQGGHLLGRQESELHKGVAQIAAVGVAERQCLVELGPCDAPLLE